MSEIDVLVDKIDALADRVEMLLESVRLKRFSIAEACEMWNVSRSTIQRRIRDGSLRPEYDDKKRPRFTLREIERASKEVF